MSKGPFYGKYRGTVMNNIDPLLIGRIQAIVPDVAGFIPSSWAMPCVPVAGINMGVFTVPPIGRACGSSSSAATRTTRSGSAAFGV